MMLGKFRAGIHQGARSGVKNSELRIKEFQGQRTDESRDEIPDPANCIRARLYAVLGSHPVRKRDETGQAPELCGGQLSFQVGFERRGFQGRSRVNCVFRSVVLYSVKSGGGRG